MKKHLANIITSFRIVCSIILLFFDVHSIFFYIIYLLCGFSDMIDGAIARKTNTVTRFGSKLDTIADFSFMVVCLIKLLPIINLSLWLWIWIGVIAIIKAVNIILCVIYRKEVIDSHTLLNKATGFLLFLLPLTLQFIEPKYSFTIICLVASIAAIQESYYTVSKNNK
ncbi:MAG: CDP-alcohol phosphatidyltransferase family protein [Clostridia bacterium]|nr:CDP-alcohol phosphatidyltransferase family protein [Clostridia bacterium]